MRHLSLPTAPPRCINQVLLAVFDADEDAVFSQESLKEVWGIPQKSALTLVRWLSLVTSSGRVSEDVIEARGERRLGECLRERVLAGCSRCGCDPAVIEELLSGRIPAQEVEERIRSLPVIKDEKWPTVLSNKANALKTLAAIVTHGADRQWMQRELAALELRARRRKRPQPEKRPPQQFDQFVFVRNDGEFGGVDNGNGCAQEPIRQRTEGALVNESVVVESNGALSIRAEVYYPANLTLTHLRALGQHFLDKAKGAARQSSKQLEPRQGDAPDSVHSDDPLAAVPSSGE